MRDWIVRAGVLLWVSFPVSAQWQSGIPTRCGQVILVTSSPSVAVSAWRRSTSDWQLALPPRRGSVGRNGVVSEAAKREGDGCTPAGIYAIRRGFGTTPIATALPYQTTTSGDIWIDAPDSPQYNQWIHVNRYPTSSYEVLRRTDGQYDRAVVIEYNTDPIIPGLGSAIFLHIWSAVGAPTAGCVATDRDTVDWLLGWINPKLYPVIVVEE